MVQAEGMDWVSSLGSDEFLDPETSRAVVSESRGVDAYAESLKRPQ
jgi:hypothetical protein